jgi:hypothetical protein
MSHMSELDIELHDAMDKAVERFKELSSEEDASFFEASDGNVYCFELKRDAVGIHAECWICYMKEHTIH